MEKAQKTESRLGGHLIYGKVYIQSSKEKDDLFHKWYWGNFNLEWRGGGTGEASLTTHAKINSREIRDLCVKSKIIKHLKDKRQKYYHDVGVGKDFLNQTKKALAV